MTLVGARSGGRVVRLKRTLEAWDREAHKSPLAMTNAPDEVMSRHDAHSRPVPVTLVGLLHLRFVPGVGVGECCGRGGGGRGRKGRAEGTEGDTIRTSCTPIPERDGYKFSADRPYASSTKHSLPCQHSQLTPPDGSGSLPSPSSKDADIGRVRSIPTDDSSAVDAMSTHEPTPEYPDSASQHPDAIHLVKFQRVLILANNSA